MDFNINNDWKNILSEELNKDYFHTLESTLNEEYKNYIIYPPKDKIFAALNKTDFHNVKCVILGQDPYHGSNQANGLSFSVSDNVPIPPSLRNIFKELNSDLGLPLYKNGDLTKWACQGVLLLNTVLTVREGLPNSHKSLGWINFTNAVIEKLNNRKDPVIFVLWGKNAIEKKKLITNPHHIVLTSPHPSPLSASRGFLGSKPFSKINSALASLGKSPIDWSLN